MIPGLQLFLLYFALLQNAVFFFLSPELLQCMLGGMQSHLDSNVVNIRRVGMVVGECVSARMNINGTKLKFEVRGFFWGREVNYCCSFVPNVRQ